MTGLDSIRETVEDAESTSGAVAYTAWMGAAATTAMAHDRKTFLPDSLVRSFLCYCLDRAEEAARGVDWSENDGFERERRDLFTNRKFQRAVEALLDRQATAHIHERRAYVGTLSTDSGNAEERLEVWLEDQGYRRNATAYLKYRIRDGREEYEQGSWAYRRTVRADEQLHVRLFDGTDEGTVDVYVHREPSITKGEEHYGTPSYRDGVCAVRRDLSAWAEGTDAITFERHEKLPTGEEPRAYDCTDADADGVTGR